MRTLLGMLGTLLLIGTLTYAHRFLVFFAGILRDTWLGDILFGTHVFF